jgi:hypothetical protein
MNVAPALQSMTLLSLLMSSLCAGGQSPDAQPPAPGTTTPTQASPQNGPPNGPQPVPPAQTPTQTPNASQPVFTNRPGLKSRPTPVDNPESGSAALTADQLEALRISKLAIINGRPYDQPSAHDQFIDYLNDSYGLPAMGRSAARALYSQAQDKPVQWDEDFTGFMQRYGAAAVTTALVGNIRYGMENVFHEDLRYIPCHGCGFKRKVENALLAEITARHDVDGHRFFTLTPTVSDFMGPIIAHSIPLYPDGINPAAGAVSARLVFATRIGAHLFEEFVWERRHHDKPIDK